MFKTTGAIISSISTDTTVPKAQFKKKKEVIHFQKQRKVTNVMNVGAILLQLVPLLLHPLFSPQALPYSPLCGKPVPEG